MSCDFCKTCGELKFDWKEHRCPPVFYVEHEIFGDDQKEFRAWNYKDAAIKFAKYYNETEDYALMNSSTDIIISDGKIKKNFRVFAEPDIYYSSDEIPAPPEEGGKE